MALESLHRAASTLRHKRHYLPPGPRPNENQMLLLAWMLDIPVDSKQHRLLKRSISGLPGMWATVSAYKPPQRRGLPPARKRRYERIAGCHIRYP